VQRAPEEETVSQSSHQIPNTVGEVNGGASHAAIEEPKSTLKYKESVPTPQKSPKPDVNSVIVTTARPATVISNSSSQLTDNFLSKEER